MSRRHRRRRPRGQRVVVAAQTLNHLGARMSLRFRFTRRPLLIASLTTTHGRVRASAVWVRSTFVLRLVGRAAALRALLIEVRPVADHARQISFRPPQPITDIDRFEPFFDATSQRWRVLHIGPFSEFAPGLPAQPIATENPPCPAAP